VVRGNDVQSSVVAATSGVTPKRSSNIKMRVRM